MQVMQVILLDVLYPPDTAFIGELNQPAYTALYFMMETHSEGTILKFQTKWQ